MIDWLISYKQTNRLRTFQWPLIGGLGQTVILAQIPQHSTLRIQNSALRIHHSQNKYPNPIYSPPAPSFLSAAKP